MDLEKKLSGLAAADSIDADHGPLYALGKTLEHSGYAFRIEREPGYERLHATGLPDISEITEKAYKLGKEIVVERYNDHVAVEVTDRDSAMALIAGIHTLDHLGEEELADGYTHDEFAGTLLYALTQPEGMVTKREYTSHIARMAADPKAYAWTSPTRFEFRRQTITPESGHLEQEYSA
jgi:hypothetical protein